MGQAVLASLESAVPEACEPSGAAAAPAESAPSASQPPPALERNPRSEVAAEVAAAELSARLARDTFGAFDEDVRAMAAREVSGLGLGHARTRSQVSPGPD